MIKPAALATVLLAGCVCGVAEDYARGTTGEWVLTRMFTDATPCPTFDAPEQLQIAISEDGVVTSLSPNITVTDYLVYTEDDRQFVDLTVNETWYHDEPDAGPGYVSAPVSYNLELIPVTARLEGTVDTSFNFHTSTTGTTCISSGAASAGRTD
jgi:hypothetical protein